VCQVSLTKVQGLTDAIHQHVSETSSGFLSFLKASLMVWFYIWYSSLLTNYLSLVNARTVLTMSILYDEQKELQSFKGTCSPSRNLTPGGDYFVRRSLSRGVHASRCFS